MNTLTRLALAAAATLPMALAMAQTTTVESADTGNAVRHRAKQLELLDVDKDGRLSRAEVQARGGLTHSFDQIDVNHDGFLGRDELRQWAQTQPVTHPTATQPRGAKHMGRNDGKFFDKHDLNHDGVITADEAAKAKNGSEMFSRADADGDGRVTRKEVHALHKVRGPAHKKPPMPKNPAPVEPVQPLAPSAAPNP